MDAREAYRAGDLTAALEGMNTEVRNNPTDQSRRGFLAELLCLSGNLERADIHLDTLGDQDSQAAPHIAVIRQLARAEQARRQFFGEGRVPEFIGAPTDVLKLHLEASLLLREGDAEAAAKKLAEAEEQRPKVSGVCDGEPFDDLRDLDDTTASFLEVLTSTGKYFWIPMERLIHVEFREPKRPRDLMWRQAAMEVRDGPDGEVYIPAIYPDPDGSNSDAAKLGKVTEWIGGDDGSPVRGVGQRTLLVGSDARPIMELQQLSVEAPAS